MIKKNTLISYAGLGLFGIFGPILFPEYTLSIAYLWMMVLMASTWDILGGQMGYNSLGNITFFGVGMYVSACVQIAFFYEGGVGEYTSAMGSIKPEFTDAEYFYGLFFGIIVAALVALAISLLLSTFMFGLRGPYFAIGSLGIAVATAELTITIDYVGGASGISMPLFPGDIEFRSTFFYILCFILTIIAHFLLRWLYSHSLVWPSMPFVMMKTKLKPWASRPWFISGLAGASLLCLWGPSGPSPAIWRASLIKKWLILFPPLVFSWWLWFCWAARAPYGGLWLARSSSMWSKRQPGHTF